MYSFREYSWMMEDEVRNRAYLAALEQTIKPGSVVVDLGAGVGTWGFIACRLGARKVYAIESDPVVHLARRIAAANGCADRIEVMQKHSTQVELPERADVVVYEIHGQQPLFEGSLGTIIDARERFLKPGGVLLPMRETLWAGVVEDAEAYDEFVGFWGKPFHGVDMSAGKPLATDWMYKVRTPPEKMVSESVCYATLDYATISVPEVVADFSLTVRRDATGHGLVLWFDSELLPGIGFSNAPGSPRTIFGRTFLPWREPVSLRAGDQVQVALGFRWTKESKYVWQVRSTILSGGKEQARFNQSALTQAAAALGQNPA